MRSVRKPTIVCAKDPPCRWYRNRARVQHRARCIKAIFAERGEQGQTASNHQQNRGLNAASNVQRVVSPTAVAPPQPAVRRCRRIGRQSKRGDLREFLDRTVGSSRMVRPPPSACTPLQPRGRARFPSDFLLPRHVSLARLNAALFQSALLRLCTSSIVRADGHGPFPRFGPPATSAGFHSTGGRSGANQSLQ